MELDDLRSVWAAHGAALERSLAINERCLRELVGGKARRALAAQRAWWLVEAVLVLGLAMVAAAVVAGHPAEARYLLVGAPVAGLALALAALTVRLVVTAGRVDPTADVVASQRVVEELTLAEYRATRWAVLGGVLAWLPAALLLFEAVTGVPALARVDLAWLVANLALGIVVLVAGVALSRRYVERPGSSPRARRLIDALSGRGLRATAAHLADLTSFARDDAGPRR